MNKFINLLVSLSLLLGPISPAIAGDVEDQVAAVPQPLAPVPGEIWVEKREESFVGNDGELKTKTKGTLRCLEGEGQFGSTLTEKTKIKVSFCDVQQDADQVSKLFSKAHMETPQNVGGFFAGLINEFFVEAFREQNDAWDAFVNIVSKYKDPVEVHATLVAQEQEILAKIDQVKAALGRFHADLEVAQIDVEARKRNLEAPYNASIAKLDADIAKLDAQIKALKEEQKPGFETEVAGLMKEVEKLTGQKDGATRKFNGQILAAERAIEGVYRQLMATIQELDKDCWGEGGAPSHDRLLRFVKDFEEELYLKLDRKKLEIRKKFGSSVPKAASPSEKVEFAKEHYCHILECLQNGKIPTLYPTKEGFVERNLHVSLLSFLPDTDQIIASLEKFFEADLESIRAYTRLKQFSDIEKEVTKLKKLLGNNKRTSASNGYARGDVLVSNALQENSIKQALIRGMKSIAINSETREDPGRGKKMLRHAGVIDHENDNIEASLMPLSLEQVLDKAQALYEKVKEVNSKFTARKKNYSTFLAGNVMNLKEGDPVEKARAALEFLKKELDGIENKLAGKKITPEKLDIKKLEKVLDEYSKQDLDNVIDNLVREAGGRVVKEGLARDLEKVELELQKIRDKVGVSDIPTREVTSSLNSVFEGIRGSIGSVQQAEEQRLEELKAKAGKLSDLVLGNREAAGCRIELTAGNQQGADFRSHIAFPCAFQKAGVLDADVLEIYNIVSEYQLYEHLSIISLPKRTDLENDVDDFKLSFNQFFAKKVAKWKKAKDFPTFDLGDVQILLDPTGELVYEVSVLK